jgi:hypothetical protein
VFFIFLVLRHLAGALAGVITQRQPAPDDVAGVRSKWRATSHVFRRACGSKHQLIPSKGIAVEWALGGQLGAGMGLEGRPQAVGLGQSRLQGCVIVKNVGVDPQCDGRVSVAQPRGNH